MVTRVGLVSCVKTKRSTASAAQDLYLSQLFRGLRQYAETHADAWYILSAEHGVLRPEQVVEPYERTLNTMPKVERVAWAKRVQHQLLSMLPADSEIILLAGLRYREEIEPFLRSRGFRVTIPLEGLMIGEQLQRLKRISQMASTASEQLDQFYSLLSRLAGAPGQGQPLRDLPGPSFLPGRGVYFFLEPGESRAKDPSVRRVVRVGTHAVSTGSKSTLRGRLLQHLGTRSGGGNHRGSIFRLHTGAALLARDKIVHPTWGVGSSALRFIRDAELEWEKRVSEYIGNMPVFWIAIPDDAGPQSDRAFIERNAIALLSNQFAPLDAASPDWLGRFSPRKAIRESSLWNLNYVDGECDHRFLDRFESFVSLTCQK